jgi:long-subunit fatty acid transport protein
MLLKLSSKFFNCVVTVFVVLPLFAHAQDAGKSGLAFLKIGAGSRAAAMGEAYVALVNDANAIYWNPAGLALSNNAQLSVTHLEWLENINHNFAAITFRGFGGTLGLAITTQAIPGIELRDKPTAEPLGTFEARDVAFAVAYGKKWSDNLAAGVALKALYEKIYLNSANGFAVDLGVNWQSPLSQLRFGIAAQNLGSMSALIDEKIKLPAAVRIGAAYQLFKSENGNGVTLSADHLTYLEGGAYPSAGAEWWLRGVLALRAGYQFGRENRGLAAGLGASLGKYRLDYGFASYQNDLGQTQSFSIAVGL